MLDALQGTRAEEAWRWFIERYRPFIRESLRRMLARPDATQQAENDIWSYLFTSRVFERADRNRRFRSYLSGVVRNYAKKWLRENRLEGGADNNVDVDISVKDRLPEEEEERIFVEHVFGLAMRELSARHPENGTALRLFYGIPEPGDSRLVEPMSVTEIARVLDLEPNAVHQTLHRARKRFKACIEAELRETVRDPASLEEEMIVFRRIVEQATPGLTG
jgi:RNA polymerase sigma factor (sigma-70 family)